MRNVLQRLLTITVVAVLLTPGVVAAQATTDLTGGNADQIWNGPVANAKAGLWLDQGAVGSDGRSDLIIGAPGTASVVGKVYVIFGGPVRTGQVNLSNADVVVSGAAAGDLFGTSTAAGNILNREGDASRNLVIGAPGALGNRGKVYLYVAGFHEGDLRTTADAALTIIGKTGDRLGTAIATADLNGDGHREIIIGAGGTDHIYIINAFAAVSGTIDLSNPATPADVTIQGTGLGDVLTAADVTGDGISDLLAGSAELNVVYMYKGRATGGLPVTPDAGFSGVRFGDLTGASVRTGDFDSDGIRDVVIGAPGFDGANNDRVDAGAAFLLWGSPNLISRNLASADVTFYGGTAGDRAGAGLTAGDINRDTPNDLVILSPGARGGAGELDMYYGRRRSIFGPGVDLAAAGSVDRTIVGDGTVGPMASSQVFEVTGEGARDLIVGVPTGDGNAGLVYFTISPRMIPRTRTINLTVNENGAVSAGDSVVNPSNVPITWSVSANRPWLTTGPSTGSAVRAAEGAFGITGAAPGLAPGTYTGTVTLTSTSPHLQMAVPITVNLTVTSTRIFIDSPSNGTTVVQPFTISGWAMESTSTATTGVDSVHVYAYRNPGSGTAPVFLGVATYGFPRGDVAAAYGPQFLNSGYRLPVTGLKPGSYRLVVYAHHAASGVFTHFNWADVNVRNDPWMGVYSPTHNATVSSAFEISGWALDRASAVGPGVDAIHVYVFPNVGSGQAPVFIGTASYGWTRTDVGAAFGSQFTNSGFHFTITGLGPGTHDLAMYAHSTVSGEFDKVQVNRITVNPNELMGIDLPSAESKSGRDFWAAGWAIDRGAAAGTGVDAVHVYAYKDPGSNTPPVFLGVAVYGQARPDVVAFYGQRFLNCAFALHVTTLTPGTYDIVMFAHSTRTNSFSNWAVVRTTVQ